MSSFVFRGGRVLADQCQHDSCAFEVEGGVIAGFHAVGDAETIDLDGGWLIPGFVDTQVNGGGGVLFNDHPTVEGIRAIIVVSPGEDESRARLKHGGGDPGDHTGRE